MADGTPPTDLGQVAYEAESAWLDEIMPGAPTPSWDALDAEHRGVYQRIAGAVAAAERERIRLAVRQSCACGSCKSFIAGLIGEPVKGGSEEGAGHG